MKQDNESAEIQPKRWPDLHCRDDFTSGCNHWGDLLDHLRSCAKDLQLLPQTAQV